jgi:hypothetical protein
MTLLEQIQQNLQHLPPEKQSEVLDFIVFLQGRQPTSQPKPSVRPKKLQKSLLRLAALGTFADIKDPSAWQREIRQDRPLQGRDL